MDEYKFQHEQTQAQKKEAVDAVNRTLWLQHWKMLRAQVLGEFCAAIVYTAAEVIPIGFPELSKTGFPLSGFPPFLYQMSAIFLVALAIVITMRRLSITDTNHKPVRGFIKRPTGFYVATGFMFLLVLVLKRAFKIHSPAPNLAIVFWLLTLWDWPQMRKLKRNLISWGVIQHKDSILEVANVSPIKTQLAESEARIDATLGLPNPHKAKKKLFVKSTPS